MSSECEPIVSSLYYITTLTSWPLVAQMRGANFLAMVHILLHTPLCTQQLAAAAIKQCTTSLIDTAEKALLQIEDDPYALMQSPVASTGQFRPCLGRQDSEIIRIQENMERTGKVLTKIQLEWI